MQKEDGQGVLRTVIEKGTVRVGSLDDMSGSYGRFVHVTCWRVPQRVWEKLPDPPADEAIFLKAMLEMDAVIFKGFSDLEIDDQRAIVEHMMDKANWTRHDADGKCNLKRKPKDAEAPALEGPAKKAKVIDLTGESPVKSETKKAPAKKKKATKKRKAPAKKKKTTKKKKKTKENKKNKENNNKKKKRKKKKKKKEKKKKEKEKQKEKGRRRRR